MATEIPILEIDGLFIVSIQNELDDNLALKLYNDLSQKLWASGVSGIVIDFTAVPIVDSFIARIIGDISRLTHLMGSTLVVTGLKPQVAISLIELGITLPNVTTALNLQNGIDLLRQKREIK